MIPFAEPLVFQEPNPCDVCQALFKGLYGMFGIHKGHPLFEDFVHVNLEWLWLGSGWLRFGSLRVVSGWAWGGGGGVGAACTHTTAFSFPKLHPKP